MLAESAALAQASSPRAVQNEWQELTLGAGPVGGDHLDLVLETTPFRPADVIPGSEDKRSLGLELPPCAFWRCRATWPSG